MNNTREKNYKPGVMVHICNPGIWKAEAGGSKHQASLSYAVTLRPVCSVYDPLLRAVGRQQANKLQQPVPPSGETGNADGHHWALETLASEADAHSHF